MDLFEHSRQEQFEREAPLAHRLRPRGFEEFFGGVSQDGCQLGGVIEGAALMGEYVEDVGEAFYETPVSLFAGLQGEGGGLGVVDVCVGADGA